MHASVFAWIFRSSRRVGRCDVSRCYDWCRQMQAHKRLIRVNGTPVQRLALNPTCGRIPNVAVVHAVVAVLDRIEWPSQTASAEKSGQWECYQLRYLALTPLCT